MQEKLGLSAEQKEKLQKIKKELDEKSLGVLTGEQKKKLEELKSEQPRRGPGRQPGAGRQPNQGRRPGTNPQPEKKKDI